MATVTGPNPLAAIAQRLARVRADSGLNQSQFAERIAIPKRTYLGWERAETEPPIWMLKAIHREFGVDPVWILNGPGETPVQHNSVLDRQRLVRLMGEVSRYLEEFKLKLDNEHLLDLALTVLDQPAHLEKAGLAAMKRTLSNLARGKL